jgi:prepilin-type N-terminal cleavage/methylation domain-containing protein
MTPPSSSFCERENAFGRKGAGAFSLVELLVVLTVIGMLLALTVPAFVAVAPSRKSAMYELVGFLEGARARAMAAQAEMIVAFADGAFPGEGAYRSYALFVVDGGAEEVPDAGAVRQLSPWKSLPAGMVFAHHDHFEVRDGTAFRTLFDLPVKHLFPMPPAFPGGEGGLVALPYLHFGPQGEIRFPPFRDADALHLGVIGGFYSPAAGRLELSGAPPGVDGRGPYAVGELLGIGFYTGRSRLLTD